VTRIGWNEAREAAHRAVRPLPKQLVPLDQALGSTLAEPLAALVGLPAFPTAAMDGYAVRGEGAWTLVGRLLAGEQPRGPLRDGAAVEVATGCAVPAGTWAVLPYEDAHRDGDAIEGTVAPGRNVRSEGEECAAGDILGGPGTRVTPVFLGLAAAAGHDQLCVHPRPRVTAVVTGDEIVHSGPSAPGKIRDAVGPQLSGWVRWLGADLVGLNYLADDLDALTAALSDVDSEVIVTSGGCAAGPTDQLSAALTKLGAGVVVDGVACRPGHPMRLARLATGRWLVALPGNPFAAVAGIVTLLAPLLDGLVAAQPGPLGPARLSPQVQAHATDTRLLPVRISGHTAVPVGYDRPAMLRGVAEADWLAVVPPGWRGEPVELLPLPH
jgi:molybdopterin molybdotransferase